MKGISRRTFLRGVSVSSVGIVVAGCARRSEQKEVAAIEDLMREHGVLRRALLVYAETAPKLRQDASPVMGERLLKTAKLFRSFGEDYHEKKLEEVHIFPVLKKSGGPVAALVGTLTAQHERGQQITDYILAATEQDKITHDRAVEVGKVLESFVLMYQNHAAREDTVIFPAWKQALSAGELWEMAEKFEEIEHEQFGEDGFEQAVGQITEIEQDLGLADIAQFTAQLPPDP